MNTPRFLLAKYIPDLRRGEPRNIGVVVWTPERVVTRFVAEREDALGEVDGRSVPAFVDSVNAYKQWVKYWSKTANASSLKPVSGGTELSRSDEQFLNALKETSRGNFVLVDAGFGLDPLASNDLQGFADHLFETLISTQPPEEPCDFTLDEACEDLIQRTRLEEDPNFKSSYAVDCQVADGIQEKFEFSHAYKNGTLEPVAQTLPQERT